MLKRTLVFSSLMNTAGLSRCVLDIVDHWKVPKCI